MSAADPADGGQGDKTAGCAEQEAGEGPSEAGGREEALMGDPSPLLKMTMESPTETRRAVPIHSDK